MAKYFEKEKHQLVIKRSAAGNDLPVFRSSRFPLANNNSWCIFPGIIHALSDVP